MCHDISRAETQRQAATHEVVNKRAAKPYKPCKNWKTATRRTSRTKGRPYDACGARVSRSGTKCKNRTWKKLVWGEATHQADRAMCI